MAWSLPWICNVDAQSHGKHLFQFQILESRHCEERDDVFHPHRAVEPNALQPLEALRICGDVGEPVYIDVLPICVEYNQLLHIGYKQKEKLKRPVMFTEFPVQMTGETGIE
jgi:hypothetical protein